LIDAVDLLTVTMLPSPAKPKKLDRLSRAEPAWKIA